MSFINLRLLLEDGVKQELFRPGEKLCPVMSTVVIEHAPMEKEPGLNVKSIICVGELCGMFNRCNNTPGATP